MSSPIDDSTIRTLQLALGRFSDRASVVAANLANVDTPGYRAMRANFPEQLDVALAAQRATRHPDHFRFDPRYEGRRVDPQLEEAPVTRVRPDGNTVDVDVEMTTLAGLRGKYDASAQLVRKRFALLRYAAADGRSA